MIGDAAALLPGSGDSIVAIATAPGRGAIALIRLSGPSCMATAMQLVRPWPGESRRPTLCTIVDGDGVQLDEAIVTLFDSPGSFTGEDMVEISTHGGLLVPSSVVAALIRSGARPAMPGEFTRRAVLNGKLDLIQAEAIGDLIDSTSGGMQRAALRQMEGGLSRRVLSLRSSLIELETLLSYDIDFPEEDDGPVARDTILATASGILEALDSLLGTAAAGEILQVGAVVVIAGPPNAGKSSLFNALLGHSRAIVTELPGTTRDAIEAMMETGTWPVRLIDTAGLRHTDDFLERIGIEVSERYLKAADIVLCCAESPYALEEVSRVIAGFTDARRLRVLTKCDLVAQRDEISPEVVRVSAETGEGLSALVGEIERTIADVTHVQADSPDPILTRARQVTAVAAAREELSLFVKSWEAEELPASVAAVHVREAASILEELVGAIDVEDVLDRLFSSFCVGK